MRAWLPVASRSPLHTSLSGTPERPIELCSAANGCIGMIEHHGRDVDRADREPFQQLGQRVVMVGVGMGNDDRVEMRDAARPEKACHGSRGVRRRAQPAGIVEQASRPPGSSTTTAAPWPTDRNVHCKRSPSCDRSTGDRQAEGRPAGQQAQAPAARRRETRHDQPQHKRAVKAGQPPIVRPGDPKVAAAPAAGNLHAGFHGSQVRVAEPAQRRRQRRHQPAAQRKCRNPSPSPPPPESPAPGRARSRSATPNENGPSPAGRSPARSPSWPWSLAPASRRRTASGDRAMAGWRRSADRADRPAAGSARRCASQASTATDRNESCVPA